MHSMCILIQNFFFFSSDLDQTSKENGCDVMLIMHWALLFNILSHKNENVFFFVFLIVLT